MAALVVAYEIQMRLQDAANLNKLGWDQANYVSVTVAAAASRLMKLDRARRGRRDAGRQHSLKILDFVHLPRFGMRVDTIEQRLVAKAKPQ